MGMQREPRSFSVGEMIGGLAIALVVGAVLVEVAMRQHDKVLGFGIGAVPGLLLAGLAAAAKQKNGFTQGLLIGGCIIALIGGACGASMAGTTFH